MKSLFSGKIKDIAEFLIHSIRKLKVRIAYDEEGIVGAQKMAQHTKSETTVRFYLDLTQDRKPLQWRKRADNIVSDYNDDYIACEEASSEDEDGNEDEDASVISLQIVKKLPVLQDIEHHIRGSEEKNDDGVCFINTFSTNTIDTLLSHAGS